VSGKQTAELMEVFVTLVRHWLSTCFERAARGREAHSLSEDSQQESYRSTVNFVIRYVILSWSVSQRSDIKEGIWSSLL